ncbi:hypothetical protein Q5752_003271 [Cryptotrichosporon argae]
MTSAQHVKLPPCITVSRPSEPITVPTHEPGERDWNPPLTHKSTLEPDCVDGVVLRRLGPNRTFVTLSGIDKPPYPYPPLNAESTDSAGANPPARVTLGQCYYDQGRTWHVYAAEVEGDGKKRAVLAKVTSPQEAGGAKDPDHEGHGRAVNEGYIYRERLRPAGLEGAMVPA